MSDERRDPDLDIVTARKRIAQLEAALARIQWGSCDGCGNHRHCPACKGSVPTEAADGSGVYGGHVEGCTVGEALGGPWVQKELA